MSVLLASVAFWAPVTYVCIGDDHQPEKLQFRARFKRLKKSERKQMDARLAAGRLTAEVKALLESRLADPATTQELRDELRLGLDATPISDAEFLDEMLVDWDLKNRRGEPVIYSPTARKDCEEELDGMDTALIGAYFDAKRAALSPEAIAKNSEPQPATTS